jgi:asparagine synthase (glutamine-hydrolysing)
MPGATVVRARDGALPREAVERALESARFGGPATIRRVVDRDRLVVATTDAPAYPVAVVRTPDGPVVLDGAVYDLPAADRRDRLRAVGAALRRGDQATLARFLGRDGEFAVVAASGDGVALLTDAAGGLPCYHAVVGDCEVVTREPRVVRTLARVLDDPPALDRLAAAQRLLFGHPLGRRTPFAGVERLPPATRLSLPTDADATERRVDPVDPTTDGPLADRLVEACRRRAADDPDARTVVPLTGARGERATLAGLVAGETDPLAAVLAGADATDDGTAARETARALRVPWERHDRRRRPDAERTLFDWTQGTVSLGSADRVRFLDRLAEAGPTAVVAAHDPPPAPEGDGALAHLLGARARLPAGDAARIAGVDGGRLIESVRERVPDDRGPEAALARFDRRERLANGVAPRLDRARHRCWATDPLFAPAVRAASPGHVRAALAALDPETPERGRDGRAFARVRRALSRLPSLGGGTADPGVDDVLADRVRVCLLTSDPAAAALDPEAVGRALDADRGTDAAWFDALTVAACAAALDADREGRPTVARRSSR